MTSPDSPSPRTEAEAPSTREAWALHVATFRAFGDDPGTHALGYARCQQLGRELALLGFEVRAAQEAPAPEGLRACFSCGRPGFFAGDRKHDCRPAAPPSPAEPPLADEDGRLIDTYPALGDLSETIELELGMHHPAANWECDCGNQLPGETFWHHVAAGVDYRLTATDGDA